jgi:hypothetical protein
VVVRRDDTAAAQLESPGMELAESSCPHIAGIRRRVAASDKKWDGRNRFGRCNAICLLANWRPTFCSTLGTFSFFVPAPRLFFFMGRLIMPTELLHRGSRCRDGVGQERENMLGTILIILLILLLVGALPTWPYSTGWGYYPGGGIGLILIIVLLLVLVGRI